ncbi:MAG: hypothetical protein QOF70_5430 [Acetobacteraceae bacterium]|nr:hypothetical protein [Acetobacteraceae bacterium]
MPRIAGSCERPLSMARPAQHDQKRLTLSGDQREVPNPHSESRGYTPQSSPHVDQRCIADPRAAATYGRAAMITRSGCIAVTAALGLSIASAGFVHPRLSALAFAQASDMAGIAHTESISAGAIVKTVDLQTRTVTLEAPGGNTIDLKIGDQVQNLPQVRPGDTAIAVYYTSSGYVLAPPGSKLQDDSLTISSARAAPGEKPRCAV